MIITKLNGGLGNQLFEYACARNLQLKNEDTLFLDIEGFKRSSRHYSLENFKLSNDVKLLTEKDSRSLLFLQAISKYNRNLAFKLGSLFGAFIWKSSNYKPLNVGNTKGRKLYLYGYWQSYDYFKENAELIRRELKVKSVIPTECAELLKEVNKNNSICVHIRRGDYVSCGFLHCDEAYYQRGIKYIYEKHSDSNIIVFSDDIEWVKQNMSFDYSVTYVDVDVPDYEVLRLMYLCKHFVMSNSSFSWWASYLSDNANKIIIAPEYWLPDNKENKSIYMDNWTVL